jgi:hypothetical protein
MVAGGMGFGHSPGYTVLKESMEEATIPLEIARNAVPVGTISYTKLSKDETDSQPETQVIDFFFFVYLLVCCGTI